MCMCVGVCVYIYTGTNVEDRMLCRMKLSKFLNTLLKFLTHDSA